MSDEEITATTDEVQETDEGTSTESPSFEERFNALEGKLLSGATNDTKEDDGRLSFEDVKKAYPGAADIAIKTALSHDDYDPARVLRIAKASNADFVRGTEHGASSATKDLVDEIKSLKESLETEVQKRVEEQLDVLKKEQTEAWGAPSVNVGTGVSGGEISPDDFSKALKSGLSDAQAEALLKRVNWSGNNPYGKSLKER